MKALVLTKPHELVLQEVPEPKIRDHELLVEVKAAGICGSDVHGVTGTTGRRIPPLIMGHEAAGVVVRTGSAVTRFAQGDRVTFDSTVYCNRCDYCLSGRINLCDNRQVLGVSCPEHRRDGAFAEYVAVPEHISFRIPDRMSFQEAAMVEPVSIAFHAVERAGLRLNESVAVIGCGIIGLFTIQAARLAGCGLLIAVDLKKDNLELAKQLGADVCLDAREVDVAAEVRRLADGRGVETSFEAVGLESTIETAFACIRKGGTLVCIGNWDEQLRLPLRELITKDADVLGSCASSGEFGACIDMIARGRVDVRSLMSKVVPLEEAPRWFEVLLEGKEPLFKVILEP